MKPNATPNSSAPSGSSREPLRRPQPEATRPRASRSPRFRSEVSAGGIIYRHRGGHIEIFFIRDPYGRWTFPKGHKELGESLAQTAVREIKEETGLADLRFVAPVGRTTFRFRREGTLIEKTVFFFLFEAPLEAKEKLTGEGAIWEALWVKAHEAFSASSYRNLDRLLSKSLRLIAVEERRRGRRGPRTSSS